MLAQRQTKYTSLVRSIMQTVGHATNGELLARVQKQYPEVSATTIHRVTTRLLLSGELSEAPLFNGAVRLDANLIEHDHFQCTICGGIRDIDVVDTVKPALTKALGGCHVTGRIVISGSCESCNKEGEV